MSGHETRKREAAIFVAAGLLFGAVVAAAPPARAGCQIVLPNEQVCDDPIQPDGTWRRCTFKNFAVAPCTTMTDHESLPYGPPGHIDGPNNFALLPP